MLLSIIIISYNTKNLTIDCINSVIDQSLSEDYEIVIVDNASTDGSQISIKQNFPKCKFIELKCNIGFGPANNIAVQNSFGKYVLLLNPDTLILENAIDRVLNFAKEQPLAKIWGGRTVFADGSLNPSSCWKHMSLWTLTCQALGLSRAFMNSQIFNAEAYGGWKRDTVRNVDIVTGCFLLIERQLWQQLDGFDETFFMYAEEADLCLRAKKAGAKPMITPDATIIHYGGASETVRSEKVIRLFCGKLTLAKKHWPSWKVTVAKALFKLMAIVRIAAFKLACQMRSNPEDSTKLAEWRHIWAERHSWINGYNGRHS